MPAKASRPRFELLHRRDERGERHARAVVRHAVAAATGSTTRAVGFAAGFGFAVGFGFALTVAASAPRASAPAARARRRVPLHRPAPGVAVTGVPCGRERACVGVGRRRLGSDRERRRIGRGDAA